MGCGPSQDSAVVQQSTEHSPQTDRKGIDTKKIRRLIGNQRTETAIQAFQRLDEEIARIENDSPGPRLTTAEAWVEHLESMQIAVDENAVGILMKKEQTNGTPLIDSDDIDESLLSSDSSSDKDQKDLIKVRKMAIKLGIAYDPVKAAKQEEFLAKVSRGLMDVESVKLKNDMIEHAKKRVSLLLDSYNKLRELYAEQDTLIASISGGTYSTSFEQSLDLELETAREIRDRLGGVAEQWRTSGNLLRACAKCALQGFEYWSHVGPSKIASERIQLTLDARTACHSSLAAFEAAQQALPQVEIPFVSVRQASAVRHAVIYLLTDMANDARYQHTKTVLETYQQNTDKAVNWLQETYRKTLHKDLDDSINTVQELVKKLRQERIENYREIVGDKIYVKPNMNFNSS